MMKLIYLLFLTPIFLTAGLDVSKINTTLESFTSSKQLKFYNANKSIKIKEELTLSSFDNADVILFPKEKKLKKLAIVNSYGALRESKKNIGAIYLRKGRTQIVFIQERLKNNGLSLPEKYQKYIITECQLNPICLLKLN